MKLKEDEKYQTFWKEFGPVLKEGIYRDNDNKDKLLSLVMCHSSKGDERISLADYVDGMKSGQEAIYYMTGPSLEAVQNSPHLEAFKAKGYDVLFLVDPVDEIWVQYGTEFEGKKLQSAGKGNVELGTDEEKEQDKASLEEKSKTFEDLLKVLQTTLDEDLKEVRLSSRLTDSAACLVGDQGDLTPQMEQLMRAMGQDVPKVKRILEVNPGHPVLAKLKDKFDGNSEDPAIPRYARLLHGQALLAEGTHLADPGAFSKLVADLMVDALA
jgi:molecular chaperone HtpG